MPGLFATLPRLPYGMREIPAETAEGTTTAYYGQGSPESGIAGTYYVNTSKLDQRPLWEIPALSLHEAVPGHHHQIALQQELELPPFRRNFAFFTAFIEGWGLYAESLGEEMGLYDTPAKEMGQLSYQMWRASRLVVDTGIHAKGWDKARAVAFMRDNTALSEANIEAEVNRYISWPGQALAYKIGELKIGAAREGRKGARARNSTCAASTTRCCCRARCRSTCSRRRSTPGSRRRRRARSVIPAKAGTSVEKRSAGLHRGPGFAGMTLPPGSPSPGRRSRRQARTISFQQPLSRPGRRSSSSRCRSGRHTRGFGARGPARCCRDRPRWRNRAARWGSGSARSRAGGRRRRSRRRRPRGQGSLP